MPLIRDFVPLAGLDQLVFGAWDPISDTAYEAALKCGVLDRHDHIEPIAAVLKEIEPMPAVFDQNYVRRHRRHQRQARRRPSETSPRRCARTSAISRRRTPATGWW